MLQALRRSVRAAFYQQLWRKYIDVRTQTSPAAQSTPLAKLAQLVMDVWREERPNRQSGSLPMGILELTCNFIRNYQNNTNFERLQICVYIVDELALAYTDECMRDMRDTRSAQLFQEISMALQHIYGHPVLMIGSSTTQLNVPANEDPTWLKKLEDTRKNTSEAGTPLRMIDSPQTPLDRTAERRGTVKEGVLYRLLGRAPTVAIEDNV